MRQNTRRIQRAKVVVRAQIPYAMKTSTLQKLEHDVRYSSFSYLIGCLLNEDVAEEYGSCTDYALYLSGFRAVWKGLCYNIHVLNVGSELGVRKASASLNNI